VSVQVSNYSKAVNWNKAAERTLYTLSSCCELEQSGRSRCHGSMQTRTPKRTHTLHDLVACCSMRFAITIALTNLTITPWKCSQVRNQQHIYSGFVNLEDLSLQSSKFFFIEIGFMYVRL
jgi:hypothetical protein